ncbi:Serine/threonine-protein kinase STY17 [Dichanthelium oligosanthes]|uniref:non-specific serine/threonine protein kinase n=1 Tax=Dichanthelium oligosanthes TaxID=888268 RepID=A0A1E5VVH1_9POAL|nr:Serine/threonine-protein kinase STY17 [Dichanthelium oligosanthes]
MEGHRVHPQPQPQPQQRPESERTKLGVYHDVLRRLRDAAAPEALAPDFADRLWVHFHRFSVRCKLRRRILAAPLIKLRIHGFLLVPNTLVILLLPVVPQVPAEVDATEPNSAEEGAPATPRKLKYATSRFVTFQCLFYPTNIYIVCFVGVSMHPEPIFGSSQNLKALVREASSRNLLDDGDAVLSYMVPKFHGQLNLDIKEVHAVSTNDGYFLDIFIVVGWDHKETRQLEEALDKEIHNYKTQFCIVKTLVQMHSTSSCWPPELAGKQCPNDSQGNHVEIPKDNTDEWEINFKALAFQDKVASGTYGDLYRGTYFGEDVAIKVLKSDRLNENMEKEFAHEVYIMRKIRHKNIVRFLGACTKPKTLCIVTEFMKNGSVYDFLHKRKGSFKLPGLLKAAADISKGMDYLHQNRIIHRDLKTANLLMDEHEAIKYNQSASLHTMACYIVSFLSLLYCKIFNFELITNDTFQLIKVADFGVARVKAETGVMTAETGTYRWMAPEVIEHKPYDSKADVFSFGIVLWELLTGKVTGRLIPYEFLTPLQAAIGVVQEGLRPLIPKGTNPKLSQLLEKCWQQNPINRPDFTEILQTLNEIAEEVAMDPNKPHKEKEKGGSFFSFGKGH